MHLNKEKFKIYFPYIYWSFIIFFTSFMMISTLRENKRYVMVHAFIHGDFLVHIPLIKSFYYGGNFHPIEYPLFVGEKINYHYGFHILAAILERLGLPFTYAVNILAIVSFIAFLYFMYIITRLITKDKIAPYISAILPFLNFSFTWLLYLYKHGQRWLVDLPKLKEYTCFGPWDGCIISIFWNMNIYMNQRHLAMGFALTFLSIYLIGYLFSKVNNPLKKMGIIFLNLLIFISLVYIHKGMLVVVLVFGGLYLGIKFLYIIYLWKVYKGEDKKALLGVNLKDFLYLFIAMVIGSALVLLFLELAYSQFTRPNGISVIRPFWGFVYRSPKMLRHMKVPQFVKWLIYDLANYGLLPFFAIVGFILSLKKRINIEERIFNVSIFFLSWLVFLIANSIAFSVDVPVNHKFINFSILLWEIYTAYAIIKIYKFHKIGKAIILIVAFFLVFNVFLDYIPIFNSYYILWEKVDYNPMSKWVVKNTDPRDKFLNITYDVMSLNMTGRRIFFGWDYFAMSAGYNTYKRRTEYYSFLKIYKTNPLLARRRLCKIMKKYDLKYVFLRGKGKFIDLDIDANELAKTLFSGIKPLYHDDITYIYSYGEICKEKQ